MQYVFYLLAASLFTSKSALTLFSYLSILTGFYFFIKNYNHPETREKKIIFTFVGIYLLAILANLFSLGGVDSAIKTAAIWIWPLFVFVAYYFCHHQDIFKKSLYVASVGLFLACVKSFWNFYHFWQSPQWSGFNADARIPAFWDVSRWSFFCCISLIVMVGFRFSKEFLKLKFWQRTYFYLLFFLTAISLFITGSRGPWIATVIGLMLFITLQTRSFKKILLLGFGLIFVLVIAIMTSKDVSERLRSIVNIKIENGIITSNNISNAGRLHMWSVAWDYIRLRPLQPTGFENTEQAYRQFLSDQGEDYQKKYLMSEFSLRDQHSSYVSLAVQFGLLYTVVLFGFVLFILLTTLISRVSEKDLFFTTCWSLTMTQMVIWIFYSSVLSYESLMLFLVLGLLVLMRPSQKVVI